MALTDYIVDKWLTFWTKKSKSQREWEAWAEVTIASRADTIENMFMNFKHIIPVSTNIFDLDEPFGWVPCEDFEQYLFPNRQLGNNTVFYFARGYRDQWDNRFHLSDLQHEHDQVFVATNSDSDAIMITLKYAG